MLEDKKLLVVGGTGHLGRKVVEAAKKRGHAVRALVRPGTSSDALAALNAEVVSGDMLERSSLGRALNGCDVVIATAIGYSNRRKGDSRLGIDTQGYQNLIDAAADARVRRFVFCSVLTCDKAVDVPHFYNKKLTEDYLEKRGVPFVSLRPGAFLDQGSKDFWKAGLQKGKLRFAANPDVPATFVHSFDVAGYLAQAASIDAPGGGLTIDIGCDRAVSVNEIARIMSSLLGRPIKTQVPPWPVISTILGIAGLFDPWQHDLKAMMKYFQGGTYVADTSLQERYFGRVPSIEASIRRYLDEIQLGTQVQSKTRTMPERRPHTAGPPAP